MTDYLTKLRLDVAQALGWRLTRRSPVDTDILSDAQVVYERWEHEKSAAPGFVVRDADSNAALRIIRNDIPAYGTSWAACEEIDAAIKQRGWICMIDLDKDGARVVITGFHKGRLPVDLADVTTPTFPEAFCLAFVQAVERNDADA